MNRGRSFGLLLSLAVLLTGCAGVPDVFREQVERYIGRGEFAVVVQEPGAWEPSGETLRELMLEYGMDEADIAAILSRTERAAFSRHPGGERIALSGAFPRIAVSAAARKSGRDAGAELRRIVSPGKGIVLISMGDHAWLEALDKAADPEGRFSAGDLLPGELAVFMEGDDYRLTGSFKPLELNSRKGYEAFFRLTAPDDPAAVRLSSSLKTALLALSRDDSRDKALREPASAILSGRAVKREGSVIQAGPVFVSGSFPAAAMEEL